MSLKAFHIFFILVSIALSVGFGFWALPIYFWMARASFAAGALLVVYFFWFLAKLRGLKRA